jgi:serine protease Do
MKFYKKYLIAIAAVSLGCIMALPVSSAQARVFSNVLQLDTGGAYLGIQMEDVNAGNLSKYRLNSERGAIVRSVVKGSPAEAAGIKEDDVILEFGGTQVWSSQQLSRLVRETPVGRNVDLVVSRDGKRMNLSAKLGTPEGRTTDSLREMSPEEFFGPAQRFYQYRAPEAGGIRSGIDPSVSNKPRLGVTVQPLTDQLGEFFGVPKKKGVLVSSVTEGSPSVGKLKSGDVIIRADDKDIETPEELTRLIRDKSEGPVNLRVIRDKKEITVVINLPAGEQKGFKL